MDAVDISCVCCNDADDELTYLLPCLHATCAKCVQDIVRDAADKQRKAALCSLCGEPFTQNMLTQQPATTQAIVDMEPTFCAQHSGVDAATYCVSCKAPACSVCVRETHQDAHGTKKHVCVSIADAMSQEDYDLQRGVDGLKERLPQLESAVARLSRERAELEAAIVALQQQIKTKTIQIDDLHATGSAVARVEQQAQHLMALRSWSLAQPLRPKTVVIERVRHMQRGFAEHPLFDRPVFFDRVLDQDVSVSEDRSTVTKIGETRHAYAIASDGCSSGKRTWKIKVMAAGVSSHELRFGVINSADRPSSNESYCSGHSYSISGNHFWRAGECSAVSPVTYFFAGDQVVLKLDCERRSLTLSNTTQGWMQTMIDLPAANPAFFPQVCFFYTGTSVKIEGLAS